MKKRISITVLATIILALAGLAYAQERPFNAEEGNGKWGAEPAVSPAYNGYQYFNAEIANSAPLTTAPRSAATHYGKTGKLHLKAAVNIAGGTLKRGDYDVRFVDSPGGHYVEFSKTVINHFAEEGQSPYEEKVVAEIPCTMEQLNAAVAHTELLPKTDHSVASLEIRGETVLHLF